MVVWWFVLPKIGPLRVVQLCSTLDCGNLRKDWGRIKNWRSRLVEEERMEEEVTNHGPSEEMAIILENIEVTLPNKYDAHKNGDPPEMMAGWRVHDVMESGLEIHVPTDQKHVPADESEIQGSHED